ncbi:uncharacterized protein Aud_003700 [Aspergillus udagawae]|uniref:Uncharacterized protein n=1 Tax=Aspergillus udagawae TaxID=91492 RepID=A0A8E0QQY3_9EURO|nr:uncharacterized protein Aud_003700 [Aspergillus udagawae]GIC87316.1 hypothetical protein Aud_003700 [Aspergillus udagawae]
MGYDTTDAKYCCGSVVDNKRGDGNSSSPSSHDVAIGAGVGLPLAVLALASIAWALWARRHCKYMLAWRVCRRPELRRQVNTDINIPRTVYINRIRRSSRKPGGIGVGQQRGRKIAFRPYL